MSERGSITLWMVGLVMVVFAVGGLAIDLWRGLAAHRQVAAVVDSAAIAAGSGIDEPAWRTTGELSLDPARVGQLVAAVGAGSESAVTLRVSVAGDGSTASVEGATTVDLTLLRILTDGPLEITARAAVVPVLSP
ncbi:MAG TPA: pilus assembly protein TadG-related protein [Acidimicrobiia bacterium]|nr:pilus assembly protein TadG-related protein [Acidimicrobiia bacterium]